MSALRRLFEGAAEHRLAPILLLSCGLAERIGWTLAGHLANRDTELRNAAISWALTGRIADAFQPGSGPTAHVGALPPVISGIAFRVFGIDSPAAAIALTALSATSVIITALVLNRLFARFGTPSVARGAALVMICLVPLHLELESRSLRIYENGHAALILALILLAVVRLDDGRAVTARDMLGLSLLAALAMALSPTVGFCAIAILATLAVRRLSWRGRMQALALLTCVLAATMLPWALRNREAVGELVWTRDNFGLEFAIGTHAAAVSPADPAHVYLARLAQIHPHGSPAPYRALQAAGGEVAYARALGTGALNWAMANPAAAASIWVRHLGEFYFPPPWLWMHVAPPDPTLPARVLAVDVIALLGLAGLAAALVRRDGKYLYLVPPVVLLPIPYLLGQPLVRYRYVLASLLIFLAADCVARLVAWRGLNRAAMPER